MAEGFLLGPGLLSQVRKTIERVDGDIIGDGFRKIPTALEGEDVPPAGKVFRICEFTGGWNIGEEKTVTLKYITVTPNTYVATNLFADKEDNGTNQPVAIAKDGTTWYTVEFLEPEPFRIATFDGTWPIGSDKNVEFKFQTATPNTVNVTNLFWPLSNFNGSSTDCSIAKDGTSWYLVNVPLDTATMVMVLDTETHKFVNETVERTALDGINITVEFDTDNCEITLGVTNVTSTFLACGTTITAVFIKETATVTFLRVPASAESEEGGY